MKRTMQDELIIKQFSSRDNVLRNMFREGSDVRFYLRLCSDSMHNLRNRSGGRFVYNAMHYRARHNT